MTTKKQRYAEAAQEIAAVLDGEPNLIARMATVAAILHHAFDHYFWTGFYLVDPEKTDELVIGPYQGTLGCLRIPFSKGVCGACARARETIIVPDVHEFPGHIACDSRSNSEIVIPLRSQDGEVLGVLDIDSTSLAAFDDIDARELEAILKMLSQHLL